MYIQLQLHVFMCVVHGNVFIQIKCNWMTWQFVIVIIDGFDFSLHFSIYAYHPVKNKRG